MEKPESEYNLVDWWKKVFIRNYANFSGRARRSEYWYYMLGNILIFICIWVLIIAFIPEDGSDSLLGVFLSIFGGLFVLASIVPSLAVTVRRLHDTGKSGWYYFIILIPFGSVILLIWMCSEGNTFTNEYGFDPKHPDIPDFDFDENPV